MMSNMCVLLHAFCNQVIGPQASLSFSVHKEKVCFKCEMLETFVPKVWRVCVYQ
jgi:uncharacterized membrane protein